MSDEAGARPGWRPWVMDDDDELDVLRYDLEQAERKLRSMELAGQRVVNEPEWNQAVRRQRRKVEDLREELAEMEAVND